MFDPNALLRQPERPQAWDAFPVQRSEFSDEAWEESPQVDPRDPGFRQLSVPEHARVHRDDAEFEVATYVDMTKADFCVSDHSPADPIDPVVQAEVNAAEPAAGEGGPFDSLAVGADLGSELPLAVDPIGAPANAVADLEHRLSKTDGERIAAASLVDEQTDPAHATAEPAPHEASVDSRAEWEARLNDAVKQAREDAHAKGFTLGKAQGLEEGQELGLAQARDRLEPQIRAECEADRQKAIEHAVSQALADEAQQRGQALDQRDERLVHLIGQMHTQMQDALERSQAWPEAIKRLAIHVAEQLVLAELSASPSAIQRLVDRCVGELDLPHAGLVTVELAPHDLDLLKSQPDLSWNGMELVLNPQLAPGSVKVSCKDTRVSDLIQHRLEPMARQLLVAVDDWQQQSALRPGSLGARASFQSAKSGAGAGASAVATPLTPLSVGARLIDSADLGGDHG